MTRRSAAAGVSEAMGGERKVLTMLFVDLTGYTRMTATRDPEDVLRTVGPLLAGLREVAESHGAYIPSVQGDGFLAVFGAPTAHTDDPRRAVETAVAMRAVVQGGQAESAEVPEIHIGIASGEVLVTRRNEDLDILGAAVNLAARLSDAAAPGEVLVDEASAALTAESAIYGPARALALAGFTGAVRALPLVGAGRSPDPGGALVGRSDQLEVIERTLEHSRARRQGATLVITGEPGAGKSRLVDHWLTTHPELMVLRGSCRPYGSPLPLSAISEALTRARLTAESDEETATRWREFARLLPQQRRNADAPREPDEALQVAARRALEAMARRGPTVLVLDDLHWGDGSLHDVVLGLQVDPVPGPLLVLATSRDESFELPELAVPPLSREEVRQVVEDRVGAPPSAALLELLVERSAGNPLWLVECLGLLSDRGQLTVENQCAVVQESDEVEVPASIRMLVSARLDTLAEAQKAALQRISVWPSEVPVEDWPGSPEDLVSLLDVGLLERGATNGLRFTHGLVREAIYRSMPRAERVTEHERLLATNTDTAVRAHSATEIQRLEVAPDRARREFNAARAIRAVTAHAQHLRLSHTRAARDVLLRSRDLVDELDLVVPGPSATLLLELAEVLRDLEDGPGGRDVATRAVALAQLAGDEALIIQAQLCHGDALLGHDNTSARELAKAILDSAAVGNIHRARAWRLIARSHVYDDLAQVPECLERAFHGFDTAGDTEAAASTARELAWTLSATADVQFDRWLSIADSATPADHLRGQGELALIRAIVAEARGEWDQAWEAATAAIALTERVGLHRSLVDAVAVAVEAGTATGRRQALPGLLTRLAALIEGRRSRLQVTGLCASAPAYLSLGREADARAALAQAAALLSDVGPNEALMFWVATGHVEALAERHDDAEPAYERAHALASELGLTLFSHGCRLQQYAAASRANRTPPPSTLLELAAELDAARATPLAAAARALAATASS